MRKHAIDLMGEMADRCTVLQDEIATLKAELATVASERDAAIARAESAARLEREVGELRDIRDKSQSLADCVGACACGEEYTSRKLRDPDCEYHQMTPEVDELRAALASTGPSQHQAEVAR